MARTKPKPGRESFTVAKIERWMPGLPPLVRDWVVREPRIVRFVLHLEERLRHGAISRADLIRLAKRWSDALPPRRGLVVQLRRIGHQPELPMDLPATRRRARSRRKGRRRRT